MVFADIAELPTSSNGFRYILVVVDHFTKYINLYAMKDQTAATISRFLFEDYIRQHGAPDTLHTDQGRQFESSLIQQLCREFGIKKTRSSPYHPQGAGIVERVNRVVKAQLARYISDMGGDWDQHLKLVELAYNTTVHSSTGFTPYFMLHGRDARLPHSLPHRLFLPTTTCKTSDLAYSMHFNMQQHVTTKLDCSKSHPTTRIGETYSTYQETLFG